jgi:predicted nucleotide-binding protein
LASEGKVFIGHGRSEVWRQLAMFLDGNLGLEYDEFNREAAAGLANKERLENMLNEAGFAFLVMTGDDVHADGSAHSRENVIHETGLFQGRLGFRKAIVLLEDECEEFSNIAGLVQIRFPKSNIMACSEAIRDVLRREGMLK